MLTRKKKINVTKLLDSYKDDNQSHVAKPSKQVGTAKQVSKNVTCDCNRGDKHTKLCSLKLYEPNTAGKKTAAEVSVVAGGDEDGQAPAETVEESTKPYITSSGRTVIRKRKSFSPDKQQTLKRKKVSVVLKADRRVVDTKPEICESSECKDEVKIKTEQVDDTPAGSAYSSVSLAEEKESALSDGSLVSYSLKVKPIKCKSSDEVATKLKLTNTLNLIEEVPSCKQAGVNDSPDKQYTNLGGGTPILKPEQTLPIEGSVNSEVKDPDEGDSSSECEVSADNTETTEVSDLLVSDVIDTEVGDTHDNIDETDACCSLESENRLLVIKHGNTIIDVNKELRILDKGLQSISSLEHARKRCLDESVLRDDSSGMVGLSTKTSLLGENDITVDSESNEFEEDTAGGFVPSDNRAEAKPDSHEHSSHAHVSLQVPLNGNADDVKQVDDKMYDAGNIQNENCKEKANARDSNVSLQDEFDNEKQTDASCDNMHVSGKKNQRSNILPWRSNMYRSFKMAVLHMMKRVEEFKRKEDMSITEINRTISLQVKRNLVDHFTSEIVSILKGINKMIREVSGEHTGQLHLLQEGISVLATNVMMLVKSVLFGDDLDAEMVINIPLFKKMLQGIVQTGFFDRSDEVAAETLDDLAERKHEEVSNTDALAVDHHAQGEKRKLGHNEAVNIPFKRFISHIVDSSYTYEECQEMANEGITVKTECADVSHQETSSQNLLLASIKEGLRLKIANEKENCLSNLNKVNIVSDENCDGSQSRKSSPYVDFLLRLKIANEKEKVGIGSQSADDEKEEDSSELLEFGDCETNIKSHEDVLHVAEDSVDEDNRKMAETEIFDEEQYYTEKQPESESDDNESPKLVISSVFSLSEAERHLAEDGLLTNDQPTIGDVENICISSTEDDTKGKIKQGNGDKILDQGDKVNITDVSINEVSNALQDKDMPDSWFCPHCDQCFNSKEIYRDHLFKNNIPFGCTICGKTFMRKEAYTAHLGWHKRACIKDFNKYYCGACCVYCPNYGGLQTHLLNHFDRSRGENCPFCPLSFVTPAHLKKHVDLHTYGEAGSPYKCPLCENICWFIYAMKYHFKTDHPNEKMPDNFTSFGLGFKGIKKSDIRSMNLKDLQQTPAQTEDHPLVDKTIAADDKDREESEESQNNIGKETAKSVASSFKKIRRRPRTVENTAQTAGLVENVQKNIGSATDLQEDFLILYLKRKRNELMRRRNDLIDQLRRKPRYSTDDIENEPVVLTLVEEYSIFDDFMKGVQGKPNVEIISKGASKLGVGNAQDVADTTKQETKHESINHVSAGGTNGDLGPNDYEGNYVKGADDNGHKSSESFGSASHVGNKKKRCTLVPDATLFWTGTYDDVLKLMKSS